MANLKFYFTPGPCSIGIHILLEELDLVFEAYLVDLIKGDQYKPDYTAINPKGTIPTLVLDDGYFPFGEFTIVDAALFYVEFWADRINLKLPPACSQHYRRMLEKPSVRQVLMEEGYHSTLSPI